jgi:hypothetical protein
MSPVLMSPVLMSPVLMSPVPMSRGSGLRSVERTGSGRTVG